MHGLEGGLEARCEAMAEGGGGLVGCLEHVLVGLD